MGENGSTGKLQRKLWDDQGDDEEDDDGVHFEDSDDKKSEGECLFSLGSTMAQAGAQGLQSSGMNNITNGKSQASIVQHNMKGVVIRQLPMRVAKQNMTTATTSTRSNRSKI